MKRSFSELFKLLKSREKRSFFFLVLLFILAVLIDLVSVGVIPAYLALITDPKDNFLIEYLPFLKQQDLKRLMIGGAILIAFIFLLKATTRILSDYSQVKFGRGLQLRLSIDLFTTYLSSHYTFHLNKNTAELIRNVQVELALFAQSFVLPTLRIISQILLIPLLLISLLLINPIVSLTALSTLGLSIWGFNALVKKRLTKYGQIAQIERKAQLKSINEGLGGIKEILIGHHAKKFIQTFQKATAKMIKVIIFSNMANRINNPFLELVSVLGMLLVIILLILFGVSDQNLIAIVSFYVIAMLRLKQSLGQILKAYTTILANHLTVRPIYQDLGIDTESDELNEEISFNERIVLRDITYTYPEASKPSLKGINLTIKKNSSIGIIGTTGSGKTTLVDVLLGLLDPQEGQVLVDGKDIRKGKNVWKKMIGYIPQHIFLLDNSIKNNIAFGVDEHLIDLDRIWAVLELAQLDDYVESLPQTVDTITGERGIRLSGGQRQRIGIARALYHNPSILIMDEATSALDSNTEKAFLESLEKISKEVTLIIIAHRVSTIKNLDNIALVENAEIVAQSSNYAELEMFIK